MKKRSKLLKILAWVLLAAVAAALAIVPGIVRREAEQSQRRVLSAAVKSGSLTATLAGGGVLRAQEAEEVELYKGVEITELLVKNGDFVREGEALAAVDRTSVMSAVLEVRDSLDELAAQIEDLELESRFLAIRAKTPGRVKAVYARYGDSVADVMLSHGALAVLSLDGRMAVEIESEQPIRPGQSVRVGFADGRELPGLVERCLDGRAVVTLTDEGPALGELVLVRDAEGTALGGGRLYVHCAWNAQDVSGTVSYSPLREEETVTPGAIVLEIENRDPPADYIRLVSRHEEQSKKLAELLALWIDGVVTAPCAGYVSGLDDGLVVKTAASGEGLDLDGLLMLLTPEYNYAFCVITAVDEESGGVTGLTAELPDTLLTPLDDGTLLLAARALLYGTAQTQPLGVTGQPGDIFVTETVNGVSGEPRYLGHDDGLISGAQTGGYGFSLGGFGFGGLTQEAEGEGYVLRSDRLCAVTPNETMSVTVSVDELDVLQYEVGMEAEILVDALPGRVYTGTLTWLGGVGQNGGGSSKYEAELTLPADGDMMEGMNASVVVRLETVTGLLIPTAALNDRGSKTFVYTAYDAKRDLLLSPAEVETGVSDGERTLILSGLAEGQTVWYEYYGDD